MLSTIIVSYNTLTLTIECLESIFQYGKLDYIECILVDNASTDQTVKTIKKRFPKVKIIQNSQNLGFSKANNLGIKQSRGDYILLLNSDTQITSPTFFADLIKSADNQPNLGALVPKLLNSDKTPQPSAFYLPTISRAIKEYWLSQSGYFSKYLPPQDRITTVEAAVMAAMLIPRSTINKVGMLDERYFMYFEDIDYCRRILQADLSIYYDPSISLIHHHGASGKSASSSSNQWKRRIPSSKIYHGTLKHYLLTAILWSGQKLHSR